MKNAIKFLMPMALVALYFHCSAIVDFDQRDSGGKFLLALEQYFKGIDYANESINTMVKVPDYSNALARARELQQTVAMGGTLLVQELQSRVDEYNEETDALVERLEKNVQSKNGFNGSSYHSNGLSNGLLMRGLGAQATHGKVLPVRLGSIVIDDGESSSFEEM